MRRCRCALLLPLAILLVCLPTNLLVDNASSHGTELAIAQGAASTSSSTRAAPKTESDRAVPQKAYELLTQLRKRDGVPLSGYVGGREFQNRERRLPRGRYREYDVNPKRPGRPRDAERLVIEQRTGKAYYTGDHYRTFVPME